MRRRSLLLLAALAAVVRVAYIRFAIPGYRPDKDADQYLRLARTVARGDGLSILWPFTYHHPGAFRPPLYPILLGAVYRVTGVSVGVAQVLGVVTGIVTVVLAARLADRAWGVRAGVVAGVLVALWPNIVAADVTLLSDSLALTLLAAVWYLLLADRVEWAGVATGALVLTKPSAQFLAVVLGVWLIRWVGWRRAARYVVVAGLVVLPWVIRNEVLLGSPVLNTSNGFNLAARYSTYSDGGRVFADANEDVRMAPEIFAIGDEVSWDARLRALGVHGLRDRPTSLGRVVADNLGGWFELTPHANDVAERFDGRSAGVRSATWWLLPPLVLIGAAGPIADRRRPISVALLVTAAYLTIASAFTVSVPRIRSLFDLAVILGVAAASARWIPPRPIPAPPPRDVVPPRGDRRFWTVAAACLVLLLVGGAVWRHDARTAAARRVERGIAADLGAVAALRAQLPVSDPQRPTLRTEAGLAALRRLDARLHVDGVRLGGADRNASLEAARAVRLASVETDALMTQLAYLALRDGADPSLAHAVARYEATTRRSNPAFEPGATVATGAPLERALVALRAAQERLGG